MLLKTTEEIIKRNVFEQKKKKPGLSTNQPSNNAPCRISIAPVKQKVLFSSTHPTHSGQRLLKLQALVTFKFLPSLFFFKIGLDMIFNDLLATKQGSTN